MPKVGKMVITSYGSGKVVGINTKDRMIKVQLFELGKALELPPDDVVEQE